ncbi:hypothetical protein BT93_H1811 [Corymbia citriodora subsp. variegata]|nr:hypothetical protein BT93_H1811 [Corymbia citriodora subsp. variegata]
MTKKAQEFATLCGVDTYMIIYGPTGSAAATKPEIWPASPKKVNFIIEQYWSKGANCRAKRTVGLPEFFASRKRKVAMQFGKAQMTNHEAKYLISEALIEGLSEEDLRRLWDPLEHKLKAAKARSAVMKKDAMRRSSSHTYDQNVPANDHHHHMPCSIQDHCVLPRQNIHFTAPEEMMPSETSSCGPIMGNVSLEVKGTPSFGACYDAQMIMQASSQGNHRFHDHQ